MPSGRKRKKPMSIEFEINIKRKNKIWAPNKQKEKKIERGKQKEESRNKDRVKEYRNKERA